MKTNKPWGTYEILVTCKNYQVKKLTLNPKQSTSLQYHKYRCEHWIIVSGTAHVTVGNSLKEKEMQKGTHIFIHEKEVHRITNKSQLKLEIIEIQQGNYLGEDDITRLEDNYGRI